MALQWNTGTTGQTIYLVRWNTSGNAWNGAAFATYTTTRDTWDVPLTEIGVTGLYRIATVPGGDGYASIEVFRQVGGSPSHASDVSLASGVGYVRDGAFLPDAQHVRGYVTTDITEESPGNVAVNFGTFWNDDDSAASGVLLRDISTIETAVDTEVAAIYSRLGAPAGASMSADIAAVKADTTAIDAAIADPLTPAELFADMLAYAVPNSNTAGTIGDALNAARAQGFGKWSLNSTTKVLTLYGADGTTVVKSLLLGPNLSAPLTRTPQ